MASAISRLLDELSWDGNGRKYRDGGRGLENVLTTEVLKALDLLPREAFLGRVPRAATMILTADVLPHALLNAVENIERASVDVLLGDVMDPELGLRAQRDAVIESRSSYVFVEAKRIRGGSFQEEQLAREVLLAGAHGQGRQPVLLLVTGEPSPIAVKGHSRMPVEDTVELGLTRIEERRGFSVRDRTAGVALACLTWGEVSAQIEAAAEAYKNPAASTLQAVLRTATTIVDAVSSHT